MIKILCKRIKRSSSVNANKSLWTAIEITRGTTRTRRNLLHAVDLVVKQHIHNLKAQKQSCIRLGLSSFKSAITTHYNTMWETAKPFKTITRGNITIRLRIRAASK